MIPKKGEGQETGKDPKDNKETVMQQIQLLARGVEEALGRLGELEKDNRSDGAQVIAAKLVYDTPRERLGEFTRMSLRMVEPLSLAATCAAILSPAVQTGKVTLGEIRRIKIFELLRSVGGDNLLNKGAKLAEQQEVNKDQAPYEDAHLGSGL